MKKGNAKALIPILVFIVLYLGLGITFEYGLKIPMGFYNIPIIGTFLIALLVACFQNKKLSFDDKLEVMGKGVGDKNIITMILIFLVAGMFVGVLGRSSAESVAYFMLSLIPANYAVAILFIVSCLVSLAMGTSVGTITLLTPIAVAVSGASGFGIPICVASVIGGSMFGDNLSFISDTTIAACNGQGCKMKDKFKANFNIALPASLISLGVILALTVTHDCSGIVINDYNLIQIIPYLLVLILGVVGLNVFIVLIIGILSGTAVMLLTSTVTFYELLTNIGSGISGMFETTMVAILVAAICSLIDEYGGFQALLNFIKKVFKGKRRAQFGIGLLVALLDVATANNTVAIVMANPIAKDISKEFDIDKRRTASLLDTFSCIVQGMLPYGAQILVAIAAVTELGGELSAFSILPYLVYPYALLVFVIINIVFFSKKKKSTRKKKTKNEKVEA
ncbi:MAG: Na+/H+ antiporter NhaC family protein [Clostridia bacterium]|nr:Na+/H+ antiporter NhaC family protein [Clostridia bacterium]